MPVLLATSDQTHTLFHGLKLLLSLLLFSRTTPAEKSAIISHVTWMESQPNPLASCRFETFPEAQETKITITISYRKPEAHGLN